MAINAVAGPPNTLMKTIDPADAQKHLDAGELVWINYRDEPAKEIVKLGDRFNFSKAAIDDAIDIELLPKFEDHDDHFFVVIHSLAARQDRRNMLDTTEIDCFIRRNLLVTVHNKKIPSIEWLQHAVQHHVDITPDNAAVLFGLLAEVVARRYLQVFVEFERRIDELDAMALSAHADVLEQIQVLRREGATVRAVIRPQRLVLEELRRLVGSEFGTEAENELSDAYDITNQVSESLRSSRELLSDCLDTYLGASGARQARAGNVLAVYSAVMLPLTFLTGWFGMNFENLPGVKMPQGWFWTLVVMLIFAGISLAVFAHAGFIRIPGISRRREPAEGLGASMSTSVAGIRTQTSVSNGDIRSEKNTTDLPR